VAGRGVFAGNLWTMAGRVLSRGLAAGAGFLGTVVWARCFDKNVYGGYQIVVAAMAVVASFCLPGLDDASLISAAKKKDGNLRAIVKQRVVVSVIGALVVAAWAFRYITTDTAMFAALLITALVFVPIQLQSIWDAFTNGKRRFRALMIGELLVAAATLVAVSIFALFGWTSQTMLPWIVFASLGLTAVVAIALMVWLRNLVENSETDASILAYGHHVTAASLLAWVFKSDRLIVGEVLSAGDAALLAIALVLPNQVKVFFTAFEQVFLPKVTEAASVAAAWAYMRPRMFRLWLAYTLLGIAGFVLLPIFIPIFFSERYVEAAPYARWLWLSLCLSSPFTFLASILNSQRDKRFLYIKNLASPAITLLMFALLIPRWGVAGAVVARITTHGLLVILHVTYFAHAIKRSS